MSQEASKDFEKRYKATGKRFDVGKSCVRFKKLDDPVLGVNAYLWAVYEESKLRDYHFDLNKLISNGLDPNTIIPVSHKQIH